MLALSRNSLWLLLARVTAQGLAVLLIVVVARRLDVESFGQFTVIGAVVLIANTFTNFGTDTYIVREVAQTRRTIPLISRALILQLALSLLWWIVTFLLRPNPALLTYTLTLFPLALYSVGTAALRGFERMDLVWTLSLMNGLFQVIAAWLSVDLSTLCTLLLAAQCFVAALCYWICSASLPDFKVQPCKGSYALLKVTLPIAVLTLLLVVAQRLGVLTVSALLGDSATGIFTSAVRVVEGLKIGHYAILGGLLPLIVRKTDESQRAFRFGFLFLMAVSMSMAVGLVLFAHPIIHLLFGTSYAAAVPLLSMLGWSLIPYTISSFISYELIAHNQEGLLVKATAASLAVFLVLYVSLGATYALTGFVYAALVGETAQALILILLRKSVLLERQIDPLRL